jgi:hypothetical protein
MRLRWLLPVAFLLPLRLYASDATVGARVATITINPNEVTPLHLRPEFESTIRMPETVTSVVLGSPGLFKAEHSEGEPTYVYVKPITKAPAQSNLLIATKSGQQVTLELISDGVAAHSGAQPIDFLIEYRASRSFLIVSDTATPVVPKAAERTPPPVRSDTRTVSGSVPLSALDVEFEQQKRINVPNWTKWDGKQVETSIGDIRQWGNEMVVSYAIFNHAGEAVEIVPPQIQIAGNKVGKKKKQGKGIISDQLEIRDYKLSASRLEPGGRADGVVVFDRPSFKQSTEKLFLQIAQADQVDRPILIRLPFTPPISTNQQEKGAQ